MHDELELDVDGASVFCRRLPGEGVPTVLVHGNPTHSFDWIPFLERLEGPVLAPDLPGFGRSSRPGVGSFEPTLEGYPRLFARLLAEAGIEEHRLVVHDWGVVALASALARPDRVRSLVVINAVPILPGFRWHWLARAWRTRGLGEALNATTTRFAVRQLMRLARPGHRPMPEAFIDEVWQHFDRGTRRAILSLYRSADPERLAAAGERLGELRCPALVVWGERDPYIPTEMARAYAEAIPGAGLELLAEAGHWPWMDDPGVVERVATFLERS